MARIDSILSVVVQQGANELFMGTDREPKMLASGAPKRLAIPATPDAALRTLLGDILTPERETKIKAGEALDVPYDAKGAGAFRVRLVARREDGGLEVTFWRAGTEPTESAAPPPPEPVADGGALARWLERAASLGASDLHLADGELPSVRVHGALQRFADEPVADVRQAIPLDAESLTRVQSGKSADLALDIAGVGRIRVNVYRQNEAFAAAIRLLPKAAPALASLSMPMPLDDLAELPHGLVIVCGATGSGKSTTLAALAQLALERRSIVLITLEDPIEYTLAAGPRSLVRRRQIGRDVRDFPSGLRDALREDPDVLLLGEMRDPETIGLALTAAETGHLVLTSMHSRSASSAIERIVDAYPAERQGQIRGQLADSLCAIVAQRLVPKARGSGRVPALEVLRTTHAVSAVIREGKSAQIPTLLQSNRRDGMITLERCLADRIRAGLVTEAEARAHANDPVSLTNCLSS